MILIIKPTRNINLCSSRHRTHQTSSPSHPILPPTNVDAILFLREKASDLWWLWNDWIWNKRHWISCRVRNVNFPSEATLHYYTAQHHRAASPTDWANLIGPDPSRYCVLIGGTLRHMRAQYGQYGPQLNESGPFCSGCFHILQINLPENYRNCTHF